MRVFRSLGDRAMAVCLIIALTAFYQIRARADQGGSSPPDAISLLDKSNGENWLAYGRTYGEQHFSPLAQIDNTNISRLGLAWSFDLPPGNPVTVPVEVGGVLYFASGLAVVHAIDAVTGKELWQFDPKAGEAAGAKLRQGWGSRGIGYWHGKVYIGTPDGRLMAIDARSGKPVWSVLTVDRDDGRYITGAPRLFAGKVIIGHGGADSADTRGYVTTYDAETGRQLWRFFLVPGEPAKGFEDDAQAMAAKTWSGEWWKYGGGGTAWNAFTYDPETQTIFIGTGNGAPWNQKIRSNGHGDNLFLCSIVALDANTGHYKWHYQINPGETWDYNAVMDMHLADLTIAGQPRKVLIQAPKNGFLYVIDRVSGQLISAGKIAKVTWAKYIDVASGRPVEDPAARFANGRDFEMWPGPLGAHGWTPSAYSPSSRLVFIPVFEHGAIYNDRGIPPAGWHRTSGDAYDYGLNVNIGVKSELNGTGWLKAVDPVTQTIKWSIPTGKGAGGGLLATAGNLIFQGRTDSGFYAYAADSGNPLWRFDAQVPVYSAPVTYRVHGRQYVTVIVGSGATLGFSAAALKTPPDYRSQPRRVLTFTLGGAARLPASTMQLSAPPPDPGYQPDETRATAGLVTFARHCAVCHGQNAISGGGAPDLRRSAMPYDATAFSAVVHDGVLVGNGMPQFGEFSPAKLEILRQYIRREGERLRSSAVQ